MPHQPVLISWLDIVGNDNRPWLDLKEAEGFTPSSMQTVGYIVKDDPMFVTVVSTLGPDEVGNLNCIPRGCIQSIQPLTL